MNLWRKNLLKSALKDNLYPCTPLLNACLINLMIDHISILSCVEKRKKRRSFQFIVGASSFKSRVNMRNNNLKNTHFQEYEVHRG